MADAKDQHEPSMEEILASIRRIISEDGSEAAPGAAAPGPAAARGDDDVLVLTEEVDSEGEPLRADAAPEREPEPEPMMPPEPPPVRDEASENEPSVTLSEPELPGAEPEPAPVSAATEFGRRLISDTTAAASLSALSEL